MPHVLSVGRDDSLIELLRRYGVRVFERQRLREPLVNIRLAA